MLHKIAKQTFDDTRVATSFRRGLDSYEKNAVVQRQIAQHLANELMSVRQANQFDRALEFGCGTGYLTKQLTDQFEINDLIINDLVAECETKVGSIAPHSRFVAGPIQEIELPEQLDLVASSSAIQWIPDLSSLVEKTANKLKPGGWMALSGFGSDHFHELQALGSRAAAPSYTDCAELEVMLPDFMDVKHLKMDQIQLEFDGLAPLLRHLRNTGVNGNADGILTKANFKSFEERYANQFGHGGKLPLTYQPVWLIAQRQQ
ncbi:methyltransferase domain-containing protein [Maritalea porphyrae]|uniref:methyltransferase domain-containing protein n=1 Tax=Maritalea porphyrae TaxID=880732 RepID=UPI0022AEF410|nr:methyltransferase domain-containing protein [Maritalea porphyrae]MCZ4270864.1 methyltransferase domain-containing protein [Maritalea porphyrae]